MKRLVLVVLAAAAIDSALAGAASAHTRAPYLRHRAMEQEMRIRHGVRQGDLTRGERVRLRAAQRRVMRAHRCMIADGRLTARERRVMHRMLDRQSYRIHRLRHNGRMV